MPKLDYNQLVLIIIDEGLFFWHPISPNNLVLITNKKWIPGIFHYTNFGKVSWFDFTNDIKSIYGFNTTIDSISSQEYFIKTKRPKYSLLDNSKIKNTFDINQMNYLDSLNKCIKILQNES